MDDRQPAHSVCVVANLGVKQPLVDLLPLQASSAHRLRSFVLGDGVLDAIENLPQDSDLPRLLMIPSVHVPLQARRIWHLRLPCPRLRLVLRLPSRSSGLGGLGQFEWHFSEKLWPRLERTGAFRFRRLQVKLCFSDHFLSVNYVRNILQVIWIS